MTAYYNEIDPYAAQWLRNLIQAGHIASGEVDERSIADVQASDLAGYAQCHFFAGIGGWSLAFRLAGWPDDKPVWSGSCPCQPLSSAGLRKGHVDERHLWPAFYHLIAKREPPIIFGEQVESQLGREWFAGIRADLEAARYAVGGADLCAAGVGAPQIRQRIYWVADRQSGKARGAESENSVPVHASPWADSTTQAGRCCSHHNEYVRRTPPGILLVADGVSANVDAITPFGNAIVPQVAAEFIRAAT